MKTRDIIALSMIKGIGNAFIKKHLDQVESSSSLEDFVSASGIAVDDYANLNRLLERAENILYECRRQRYSVISISDKEYPDSLKDISDPPAVLYLLGDIRLMDSAIAIVGTRNSSNLGNRIAERLGKYFSNYYSICNGLVEGIDEHSIHIDGKVLPNVVGVIPGGLNYKDTCSFSHSRTIEDVLTAGGLIVSEFEPDQKEDQFSGSRVSRIQAGLSSGLILVQSSVEGGSKYTMRAFSKLGRTVGVIHFPANEEYQELSFSANRLIVEKGIDGIAQFIGLKSSKSINVKSIVILQSQNDYELFRKELLQNSLSLW